MVIIHLKLHLRLVQSLILELVTIAAGTRLVQNNGFYIFQDDITATFNGGLDWIFTYETHEIDAKAFEAAYTRQSGDDIYIDVHTVDKWANRYAKVVCNNGTLTYHDTDNVTTVDPNNIEYYGNDDHSLIRIHIDRFSVTGDWVTIPANTEFWVGDQIYKLTEDVISYFVDTGTNNGDAWVTNPVINKINKSNFTSMGWYQSNIRYTTDTPWTDVAYNRVIVDDTYIEGEGVEVTGSNYSGFFYYGGSNALLELQKVDFSEMGGSATIKEGVILWLFNNSSFVNTGAYELTEDITIQISGATGSPVYKNTEIASVSKSDINSVSNNGAHSGEIRFALSNIKIPGTYEAAAIDSNGSATLDGAATTSAYIYGGDGTSGYTGEAIIAFTGIGFGKAFQASKVGEIVTITAGTKLWISSGSGYVTIEDEWNYVFNGSTYVDADVQRTVTFNSSAATVKVDDAEVSSYTVNQGTNVIFTVDIPDGYEIASITNATLLSGNKYQTGYLFGDVTVTVNCVKPIVINQSSIQTLIPYYNASDATDFEGFRLQLKATDEINAVATNYKGTFEGTIEMKIGTTTAPTVYYYYGDGNRFLAIGCDISGLQEDDYLTIKAGSRFTYNTAIFYVESDISIITLTANFDASVHGLTLNYASRNDNGVMTSGKPKTVLKGEEVTVTYGWVEGYSQYTHNIDSVTFNGVGQDVGGTYTTAFEECTTINVTTSPKSYTVTATMKGNATLDATSKIVVGGSNVTFTVTVPVDAKIKANGVEVYTNTTTSEETYTHTINNVTADTEVAFTTLYQVIVETDGATVSGVTSGWYEYGTSITPTVQYSYNNNQSFTINGSNHTSGNAYNITSKTTINASSSNGCFAEGTLITLADGTKKAVEDLQVGDELLVFNHETGEWDTAPMFLMVHDELPKQMWKVMNLSFSNGNTLRVVWQHGLFNKTLNQYVYVAEDNVNDFIGHEFASVTYVNGIATTEYVTLENVVITEEYIKVYTPDSAYHLNVVAEDILAITPFVIPNLFEFDENMKYNEEQMQADIAQYGLYTYEDFAEYITEEEFELFPFAYYKVAVGKGWITYEEIVAVVQTFYLQ